MLLNFCCSDPYVRWGLLYNLYADKLLGFNMFPQSVYDIRKYIPFCPTRIDSNCSTTETKWYGTKLGYYGIPLDSRYGVQLVSYGVSRLLPLLAIDL